MTVLKRRTRIISFRLLEDEYQELERMCISSGARSISDLARAAVCQLIRDRGNHADETLEDELWKLKGRIEGLNSELKRLGELVGAAPAGGANRN